MKCVLFIIFYMWRIWLTKQEALTFPEESTSLPRRKYTFLTFFNSWVSRILLCVRFRIWTCMRITFSFFKKNFSWMQYINKYDMLNFTRIYFKIVQDILCDRRSHKCAGFSKQKISYLHLEIIHKTKSIFISNSYYFLNLVNK